MVKSIIIFPIVNTDRNIRMRIAFDCDGVILNFLEHAYTLVSHLKGCSVDEVKANEKVNEWNLDQRFGLTKEQILTFWKMVEWDKLSALGNAREMFEALLEKNDVRNIYFITSLNKKHRTKRIQNLINLFGDVFSKYVYNLEEYFDAHVYTVSHDESKADVVYTLGIEVFVEDRMKNLHEAVMHMSQHCQDIKHAILIGNLQENGFLSMKSDVLCHADQYHEINVQELKDTLLSIIQTN